MTEQQPNLDALEELDRSLFDVVAGWHSPIGDRLLPRLSIAASYSRIWIGIAAALALFGGTKGRRTAVEAMAAIGITSFLANVVMKGLTRRERPSNPVPEERSLAKPDSSSFPSGHTASGAAFSGVVGRAYPTLSVPVNGLAATIGFSRVYTGVHYPGDVLGGWILGKAVAFAVTQVANRFVPEHPDT